MNYAANWNKLDSIIFLLENKISEVRAAIQDSADTEPDVELMIQAETKHLRSENEELKKREIPIYLVMDEGHYFCPKCKSEIIDANAKYCFNCGHRIIRSGGRSCDHKKEGGF